MVLNYFTINASCNSCTKIILALPWRYLLNLKLVSFHNILLYMPISLQFSLSVTPHCISIFSYPSFILILSFSLSLSPLFLSIKWYIFYTRCRVSALKRQETIVINRIKFARSGKVFDRN